MTHDPLEQMTRLLRDATADVGDVDALPPARDEAIARVADAIRARARADRRRRAFGGMAVAAGVVAVVGAGSWFAMRGAPSTVAKSAPSTDLGRMEGTGVTVLRDGRTESAERGARIAEGAELRIGAGSEAKLAFDSGTQVTIGDGARVRLVEQRKQKRFALESGAGWLTAKVAKLAADERFVVATNDAEIEVRGTAFRVSFAIPGASCAVPTSTRLAVTEGVVVVRHGGAEHRVAAGQSWPEGCAAEATPSGATANAEPSRDAVDAPAKLAAAQPAANAKAAGSLRAPDARTAPKSSQLSEQNDMFDRAMREKREGRTGDAVATLDRLLARFPEGQLAESAAVERMRLLAAGDRARGARAARDYLARWPRGFARAEAEGIAGGS